MTEFDKALELEGIVEADTPTAVLIAQYRDAKRAEAAAKASAERLRRSLLGEFEGQGAQKFADAGGHILLTRVEADSPQAYDMDLIRRLAPKAFLKATLPRQKHFRLTLGR